MPGLTAAAAAGAASRNTTGRRGGESTACCGLQAGIQVVPPWHCVRGRSARAMDQAEGCVVSVESKRRAPLPAPPKEREGGRCVGQNSSCRRQLAPCWHRRPGRQPPTGELTLLRASHQRLYSHAGLLRRFLTRQRAASPTCPTWTASWKERLRASLAIRCAMLGNWLSTGKTRSRWPALLASQNRDPLSSSSPLERAGGQSAAARGDGAGRHAAGGSRRGRPSSSRTNGSWQRGGRQPAFTPTPSHSPAGC